MANLFSTYGSHQDAPAWLLALVPAVAFFVLWSIFWKGLALWHSGQRGNVLWFVLLLVINTLGILEIIYLFGVLKLKFSQLFTKIDRTVS